MKDDDLDDATPGPRSPRLPRVAGENEGRPAAKRQKGSGKPAMFIGIGLAGLIVLAGVGAWLLFFSGGVGGEKVGNPPAVRELSKSRFVYSPVSLGSIMLKNFGAQPSEAGFEPVPSVEILGTKVLHYADIECEVTQQSENRLAIVVTRFLREPFDLAAFANTQPEWVPKQVGDKTAYSRNRREEVVFQPLPKLLVTVNRITSSNPDWKMTEAIMKRTEVDVAIPEEQWEVLNQVSGYNDITASPVKNGDGIASILPKYQAIGTRGLGTGFETYIVCVYKSDAEAKKALEEHFLTEKKKIQMMKELTDKNGGEILPTKERFAWVTGKYVRTLTITSNP